MLCTGCWVLCMGCWVTFGTEVLLPVHCPTGKKTPHTLQQHRPNTPVVLQQMGLLLCSID